MYFNSFMLNIKYKAIELAEEYYNKNFKELNEDIINRELNGEIIQNLK